MQAIHSLVDLFIHLDQHLHHLVTSNGELAYVVLFVVVFAETGLVVTPLLPGDSLLFAAGTLAAGGSMEFGWLLGGLILAAVAGDTVNCWIGSLAGPKIFQRQSRLLNQKHLERTRVFYERHGAMAVVIGRFMPIIRTFVPFVAGVAEMRYQRFLVSNIAGGILWVSVCLGAGYLWGNLPFVKRHFSLAILGVIVVSVLPGLIHWARSWRKPALEEGADR